MRDASAAQITGNAEIQNIKQILGLQVCVAANNTSVKLQELPLCVTNLPVSSTRAPGGGSCVWRVGGWVAASAHHVWVPSLPCHLQHGKVYTDAKSLRYGHLMIMTDQVG